VIGVAIFRPAVPNLLREGKLYEVRQRLLKSHFKVKNRQNHNCKQCTILSTAGSVSYLDIFYDRSVASGYVY
jgi:hypothetical protein